jgi:energy-coupling factor transport system substrate-specific component
VNNAIPLGKKSAIAIGGITLIGIVSFMWPFFAPSDSFVMAHSTDAPLIFAMIIPLLLIVVLAQLSDGGMDSKSVALLGVLAAVIAALRPLGAGLGGIEPIWVILILAGRALGPGFGFVLGALSLFVSALFTGGVGPWLPFQMLAAAWVGLGAGLLPRASGRKEILILCGYAIGATIAFGFVLNLWFWPFSLNLPEQIAFVPGAGLSENLIAWMRFNIATSLGFDLPRALLTTLLIVIAGRPILFLLRRASRKAAFGAPVTFENHITATLPAGQAEHYRR